MFTLNEECIIDVYHKETMIGIYKLDDITNIHYRRENCETMKAKFLAILFRSITVPCIIPYSLSSGYVENGKV